MVQQLHELPDLLDPQDDITYLVRVPSTNMDGSMTWSDQMMQVPPPDVPGQEIAVNREMLNSVRKLKSSRIMLEVDFFLTPMQVQEKKDERPYFGYVLIVVDHNSGMIIGFETLGADPSFSDMLARIPQAFLAILAKNRMRPHQILMQSERTYTYLMPVCEQLGIKVNPVHYLASLEEAKSAMLGFLER